MRKKTVEKAVFSPCDDCPKKEKFSFWDCMKKCERFLLHLKDVAKRKESPCKDFQCGVPGVDSKNRAKCEECPIRRAYAGSPGKTSQKGARCVLGTKEENIHLAPWEIQGGRDYRR